MAENNAVDQNKALFMNLVMMLSASAMQQLGKIPNPLSGKTEINLDGASMTIDMLEMLRARTSGNLDADEKGLLTDTLSSLQMNFVETSRAAPAGDTRDKPAAEPAAEPAGDAKETPGAGAPAPAADGKDAAKTPEAHEPRYHKSYG